MQNQRLPRQTVSQRLQDVSHALGAWGDIQIRSQAKARVCQDYIRTRKETSTEARTGAKTTAETET